MAPRKAEKTVQAPQRSGDAVPEFHLTHGRAIWVLSELGFAVGVSDTTFNHYIKSLRKLGVPFKRNEPGLHSGKLARYSYDHLMELSLALFLRVYGWLPDAILSGLIQFRQELYPIYRQAYLQSLVGEGYAIRVSGSDRATFRMTGLYLDLQIHYSGGQLVEFGPPRALTPFEALRELAAADAPARNNVPVNLSLLAARLVDCAARAPRIRRGPLPREKRSLSTDVSAHDAR
jgi:hypothetical protein